jgi:CubicO group peptidase (beta-lactamase class C family)
MSLGASSAHSVRLRNADEVTARRLQDALDAAVDQGETPGVVVRLGWIDRVDGRVLHGHCNWAAGRLAWEPAGLGCDPAPAGPHTVYDVASLTKVVVTAPVFARLFELGLAGPDTLLSSVLPSHPAAPLTLAHLLTHTSGLPAGLGLDDAWLGSEEAFERAAAAQPTHAPGTVFRYSDINFILLTAVAQRLTGRTLDALAHEWQFQPLGMRDSGFRPVDAPHRWTAVPPQRIAPTEWEGPIGAAREARPAGAAMLHGVVHDPTARRMGGVAGHAGLFSTVADLDRYARMLLQGGELEGVRVLQAASVERMLAVATTAPLAERRSLGWDIDTPLSRARGLPGQGWSPGSAGHTGFTGCALWIDRSRQAFHILLSNRVHPVARRSIVALYEQVATLAAQSLQPT